MKKILLVLAAVACLGFTAQQAKAQTYNRAIGIGLGPEMSIEYKQFFSPTSAIEGGFGYGLGQKSPMLWAVYEYHISLVDNLNLYVGGGINIGATNVNSDADFAIGIDPIVGFEYKFNGAPIALAADYKPEINFTTHPGWAVASLKIRYTF